MVAATDSMTPAPQLMRIATVIALHLRGSLPEALTNRQMCKRVFGIGRECQIQKATASVTTLATWVVPCSPDQREIVEILLRADSRDFRRCCGCSSNHHSRMTETSARILFINRDTCCQQHPESGRRSQHLSRSTKFPCSAHHSMHLGTTAA